MRKISEGESEIGKIEHSNMWSIKKVYWVDCINNVLNHGDNNNH